MIVTITGHPMPLKACLVWPNGEREQLEGIVCAQGETFQTACAREARERGAVVEFKDKTGVRLTSTRPS